MDALVRNRLRGATKALFFAGLATCGVGVRGQEPQRPREKLHLVVSRARLQPELRSAKAILTFSHNGRYLMLQDRGGIYLLSREPLKLLGYIEAANSYPARFSGDSRSIIIVSVAMGYSRWSVEEGRNLERNVFLIRDGCVDAQLSGDGALLACYRSDFRLGVLQAATGQWIFSDVIHTPDPRLTVFPALLDFNSPFAGPIGFRLSHDLEPLTDRGIYRLPMAFSPDGRALIAGEEHEAVRVDLATKKKSEVPGAIQKAMSGTMAMLDEERVLVIPRGKPGEAAVRSLSDGGVLKACNFKARSARLASDARYALLHERGGQGDQVFDLEANRAIETPANIAADVYGGELAAVTEEGELSVYRAGEKTPLASVRLSSEGLPVLRRAAVSPGLEEVALSVDGKAGLFHISGGQQIATLPAFEAANFVDADAGFFLARGEEADAAPISEHVTETAPEYVIDKVDALGAVHAMRKEGEVTDSAGPQTIVRWDGATGKTSGAWRGGKQSLRDGGTVFLDYAFDSPGGQGLILPQEKGTTWGVPLRGGAMMAQDVSVPFLLRALDPATGKELWSRSFAGLAPIPYADPQGERLVLSWRATSLGATSAARRWPVIRDALKTAKLADQNSFLEAMDARTGKSLGGVLVQTGTGPANFDWIFSVGDMILFSQDTVRVHLYSMRDGKLKGKLFGVLPAANAKSNLLALENKTGQLQLYDLSTAEKLDEQSFADPIAYMHFSADGQKLFVLTESQEAFVLDVKEVRAQKNYFQDSIACFGNHMMRRTSERQLNPDAGPKTPATP